MRTVKCVYLEPHERKVVAEAAYRALSAVIEDEDDLRFARGIANSFREDPTPLTRKRLVKVTAIFDAARERLHEQTDLDWWMREVPEDRRGRREPWSEARMAEVLAESREFQFRLVREAWEILNEASGLAELVLGEETDLSDLKKTERLAEGDVCEFRFLGSEDWRPGVVVKNGGAHYWTIRDVATGKAGYLHIEYVRAPGTDPWS
jgi:hypothetical protein